MAVGDVLRAHIKTSILETFSQELKKLSTLCNCIISLPKKENKRNELTKLYAQEENEKQSLNRFYKLFFHITIHNENNHNHIHIL